MAKARPEYFQDPQDGPSQQQLEGGLRILARLIARDLLRKGALNQNLSGSEGTSSLPITRQQDEDLPGD